MSVDWGERYRLGDTPWEKGQAHPGLPVLLDEHLEVVAHAREILVPGCGLGHDARLIATRTDAAVTGLDIAVGAVEKARSLTEAKGAQGPDWVVGDLFQWEKSYDLVFEHTCFCAIPVARRPEYVAAMSRLIPAGGFLLGIFFLNPDHDGEEGPPFGVGMDELEEFFKADFDLKWSAASADTYPSRKGGEREVCLLLQRKN